MITLPKLDHSLTFPNVAEALEEPSGLLAFGGDLSVERLRLAYASGIFPWFSEGEPILWWSPSERGVIPVLTYKASRSLRKLVNRQNLQVSVNQDFDSVIDACATIARGDAGTWITQKMTKAYKALHLAGDAHSIEVYKGTELVGGLYGVVSGRVFCGESMFHTVSNASKLALYYLIKLLNAQGAQFVDCQMVNPHLTSMGCVGMRRDEFIKKLKAEVSHALPADLWTPRMLSTNS